MKNLLKSLLVWLLLAAIPFQGFAAASMLTCGQAAAVPVAAMVHGHCDQPTTPTASPPARTHDAAANANANANVHLHADAHPHSHGAGKCNTCASCCFGAVLTPPVSSLHVPGDLPQVALVSADNGPVATVDLALPERPPKASLT